MADGGLPLDTRNVSYPKMLARSFGLLEEKFGGRHIVASSLEISIYRNFGVEHLKHIESFGKLPEATKNMKSVGLFLESVVFS